MTAKRAFYDITVAENSLGECTQADMDLYCNLAEAALDPILDADVRVRIGDTDQYTAIGNDNYTWYGPHTDEMREALGEAYQSGDWAAPERAE